MLTNNAPKNGLDFKPGKWASFSRPAGRYEEFLLALLKSEDEACADDARVAYSAPFMLNPIQSRLRH